MQINMIAAMSSNRVIGNNNTLPRHFAEDFKHFKELTTGKVVVMWYNTFVSIGKPLPNRRNIILTSKTVEWVETFTSIDAMMDKLNADQVSEIWIIWGSSIYQQFLPHTNFIYLTEIKHAYIGDTYFPVFEDQFTQVGKEEHEEMDFLVYERKTS